MIDGNSPGAFSWLSVPSQTMMFHAEAHTSTEQPASSAFRLLRAVCSETARGQSA